MMGHNGHLSPRDRLVILRAIAKGQVITLDGKHWRHNRLNRAGSAGVTRPTKIEISPRVIDLIVSDGQIEHTGTDWRLTATGQAIVDGAA